MRRLYTSRPWIRHIQGVSKILANTFNLCHDIRIVVVHSMNGLCKTVMLVISRSIIVFNIKLKLATSEEKRTLDDLDITLKKAQKKVKDAKRLLRMRQSVNPEIPMPMKRQLLNCLIGMEQNIKELRLNFHMYMHADWLERMYYNQENVTDIIAPPNTPPKVEPVELVENIN